MNSEVVNVVVSVAAISTAPLLAFCLWQLYQLNSRLGAINQSIDALDRAVEKLSGHDARLAVLEVTCQKIAKEHETIARIIGRRHDDQ